MSYEHQFTGAAITITGYELPLKINFQEGTSVADFVSWMKANEAEVEKKLLQHGAILFRNTGINDVPDFDQVIKDIAGTPLSYVDGFSPRTKLTSSTYTSTEYDADFDITMHNELSYSAKWPSKLFFSCMIPCETGGETTIADCRQILKGFRPQLLQELETKGVRYVRNLHAGGGAGPSWQQTYETESKDDVEKFCTENNVEFIWKKDGGIKLTQLRPAIIEHPVTREKVWFNQVDQFHPSHLDPDIYEALMAMYETEEDMPMYGSFGDATEIGNEKIAEIRETVDRFIVKNRWEKGDLLLVDNILVCHGRSAYTGNRKIVVSMC
jgi:alpha-ketoglutarate-dependent taurine dioxygenase